MKKSELSFKCVLPNKDAAEQIRIALKKSGLINNAKDDYLHCSFFAYNRSIIVSTNADIFCSWPDPLMNYEDAIKLIESIEPDAPKFDIKLRDEVLVSDVYSDIWELCDFARVNTDCFMVIGYGYGHKLIKYEGNEKYHGTKDAPDGWWECESGKPVWRTK